MFHKIFLFLWCLSFTTITWSQQLTIGSVSLTLGADQGSVQKIVDAHFHVIAESENPNNLLLLDSGPPVGDILGGVGFENGRISWIQKTWGSFTGKDNAVEVADALFSALESATNASGTTATINNTVRRIPGREFKSTDFVFHNRKVNLMTTSGNSKSSGRQIVITESIFRSVKN